MLVFAMGCGRRRLEARPELVPPFIECDQLGENEVRLLEDELITTKDLSRPEQHPCCGSRDGLEHGAIPFDGGLRVYLRQRVRQLRNGVSDGALLVRSRCLVLGSGGGV